MPIYTVPPWVDVPDPNAPPVGAIAITAAQLQAMGQAILDAVLDVANSPLFVPQVVRQDPVTGFWPASWDADGNPVYVGGSTTVVLRPTGRNVVVFWVGWSDPPIDTTGTATNGFRQGVDVYIRITSGS